MRESVTKEKKHILFLPFENVTFILCLLSFLVIFFVFFFLHLSLQSNQLFLFLFLKYIYWLLYVTHSLTNRVELLLLISETIKSIKVNMDLCGVNVKNNLLYPTNSFSYGTTRSSFYNAEITNCKHFQRRRIPFLVVTANAGGKKKKNNNHGGGGMYVYSSLLVVTAFALLYL